MVGKSIGTIYNANRNNIFIYNLLSDRHSPADRFELSDVLRQSYSSDNKNRNTGDNCLLVNTYLVASGYFADFCNMCRGFAAGVAYNIFWSNGTAGKEICKGIRV